MKNAFVFIVILASILLSTNNTHATLTLLDNSGDRVIFDDRSNLYWIWALHDFTNLTYDEQMNKIESDYNATSYFGINSWHLSSYDEMFELWIHPVSEISKFAPSSIDEWEMVWMGRYGLGSAGYPRTHDTVMLSYSFSDDFWTIDSVPSYSEWGDDYLHPYVGAWVNAPAPLHAPEPTSIFLLSAGMACLAGFRFLKR